jgi:threonine dehydratase
MKVPDFSDILEANERIKKFAHRTPIYTSKSINQIVECELFFKCENFQKVGAFKFRGATNAIFALSNVDASKGVATHSSGNHAAALALAAKLRGINAHVVMPSNAPEIKKKAVEEYGASITFCEPTLAARETKVIACEPAGADDAFRSFYGNQIYPSINPQTIADGLLTALGKLNYTIIKQNVDAVVTVSEEAIIAAMRLIWERMKIIVEPSSAVPLAALIENKIDVKGKKVGIILSGGNIDLKKLPFN